MTENKRRRITITNNAPQGDGKRPRRLIQKEHVVDIQRKQITILEEKLMRQSIVLTPDDIDRYVEAHTPEIRRQSFEFSSEDFPSSTPITITNNDVESYKEAQKALRQSFTLTDSDFVGQFADINFHGTRAEENVQRILRDGWMVGSGNAIGSGIYFAFGSPSVNASQTIASSYSGGNGAIITARVAWGNSISFADLIQESIGGGGDEITEWCLANGYHSVVTESYGVLLHPRYEVSRQYWETPRIQIAEIYYVKNGRLERVTI